MEQIAWYDQAVLTHLNRQDHTPLPPSTSDTHTHIHTHINTLLTSGLAVGKQFLIPYYSCQRNRYVSKLKN